MIATDLCTLMFDSQCEETFDGGTLVLSFNDTKWKATFSCGLIAVECDDASAQCAHDGDPREWPEIAQRMARALWWAIQCTSPVLVLAKSFDEAKAKVREVGLALEEVSHA